MESPDSDRLSPSLVPPPPPVKAAERVRFQFSLQSLLWVVTGSAVLMGVGVVAPGLWQVAWTVVFAALPAVLTVGVVYGQGELRTFCIGGLFPAGLKALGRWEVPGAWFLPPAGIATAVTVLVAVAATGYLCIGVRRVIERRAG